MPVAVGRIAVVVAARGEQDGTAGEDGREDDADETFLHVFTIQFTARNGGFAVPVAARAAAMVGHLILGFAIQLGGERETTEADRAAFRKAVYELDLTKFPATAAVKRAHWRPTSIGQEFAFALELALDGLSQLRGRD